MLHPRETSNSWRKASSSTDFPLKSMQNSASDEEMRKTRDLNVSVKFPQSTRDSCTIPTSINSTLKKSISVTKAGKADKSPAPPIEENNEFSFNKKGKDVSVK